MYNLLAVINQNQKKILLFGSNSSICRDLIPKLLGHNGYTNLEIHCFHRKKKIGRTIKNDRLFYHFLDFKTNLNTVHFINLFSNWKLAIFFYGDFGPIDQFKNIKVIEWGAMCDFDLIINATSLGLKNEVLNLNFANTGSDKLFYDIIYNPTETNFLKEAKKRGNRTENGKLMFIYQAKEAFRLWHEVEPEINNETLKLVEND